MGFSKALSDKLAKLKGIHLNRNIINYLICVIIASILWLLTILNKEYSAEITYPVKYVNFPAGKYPITKLPSQLLLEVNAKGFTLLGHKIRTSFLPITFNVSNYTGHLKKEGDIFEYILQTNDIKDKISSQLSNDIKLNSISPEEIIFKFATIKSKKIALRPDIDYSLKRQYILNAIVLQPDSILVSGPAPILDTLSYAETLPVKFKDLKKTTTRSVELKPIPDCTLEEKDIDIKLEVEQFTEAKRTLPITAKQIPDSMNIRLFPSSVNISYEIGLSKYDKITDKDFTFTVIYPKDTRASYLEVKPTKVPTFVKNLTYTPQKVEYILEKK